MSKKIALFKFLIIIVLGVSIVSFLVYAWTSPPAPPPLLNVPPPINVGEVPQSKEGDLNIGKGLKYWITKLGDSFALKNNKGEIKFVVGQDGKVGIGVSDPVGQLDVEGPIAFRNKNQATPYKGWIKVRDADEPEYDEELIITLYNPSHGGGGDDRSSIFIGPNSFDGNKGRVEFDAAIFFFDHGRVGIGTLDPQEKLDVVGNVKVRGALCLKDGCRDKWGDVGGEPVGTLCGIYRPACGACSRLNLPCKGYYVSSGCPPGYRRYKIATCYGNHDCRYNPVYSCIKVE